MKEMTDDQLIVFLVLCLTEEGRWSIHHTERVLDKYSFYKRLCICVRDDKMNVWYFFLEKIIKENQIPLAFSLLNDRKVSARFYEPTRYEHVYQLTRQTLDMIHLTRKMTDADTIRAQLKAALNERIKGEK